MDSSDGNVSWRENDDSKGNEFVEMLQLYTDKTATT